MLALFVCSLFLFVHTLFVQLALFLKLLLLSVRSRIRLREVKYNILISTIIIARKL